MSRPASSARYVPGWEPPHNLPRGYDGSWYMVEHRQPCGAVFMVARMLERVWCPECGEALEPDRYRQPPEGEEEDSS